jgi:hypothetical protein
MRPLVAIACLLVVCSCVTYNKCKQKFGELKPVQVTHIDSADLQIPVPPDSLTGSIQLDSLCNEWKEIQANIGDSIDALNDSIKTVSESGKLSTQHWIDKYNRLLRFKSKVIHDTIHYHHRDTVLVECPPQNVFDPDKGRTGIGKAWEQWKDFAALALLVMIIFFLMYLKTKK